MGVLVPMVLIKHFEVFADWLSISYAASQSPISEILSFLGQLTTVDELPKGKDKTLYQVSDAGTMFVTHKDSYHNFSFSGGLLAALRRLPDYRDFILALASRPHNITRLDAAFDVPVDMPLVLKNIRKVYSSGYAEICDHHRKIQYHLSDRDGVTTGTVYFQNRTYQGNVKLRVYDKKEEVFDKHGEDIPPTTRYELSIGRGASLADFQNPTSIFWHYMPEDLLRPPSDVLIKPWSPTERVAYDDVDENHTTDYETLRFLIQNSASLRSLVDRCLSVNGGAELLVREVQSAVSSKNPFRDCSDRRER